MRKTDEKSSYNILKVPKIALSDKSGNPNSVKNNYKSLKALQLMCTQLARICCGRSANCLIYGFVIQVISEKHYVATVSLAI